MLISDLPLHPKGIKTLQSSQTFFDKYAKQHLELGMKVFQNMQRHEHHGFNYRF